MQSLNDPPHKNTKQKWQWSPNSPFSRPRPHGLTPLQMMNMWLKGYNDSRITQGFKPQHRYCDRDHERFSEMLPEVGNAMFLVYILQKELI
jgi:hypothetical protein